MSETKAHPKQTSLWTYVLGPVFIASGLYLMAALISQWFFRVEFPYVGYVGVAFVIASISTIIFSPGKPSKE